MQGFIRQNCVCIKISMFFRLVAEVLIDFLLKKKHSLFLFSSESKDNWSGYGSMTDTAFIVCLMSHFPAAGTSINTNSDVVMSPYCNK